jgi:hypothetical protein
MLKFDQNIFSKYPLKKASLDFKTTRRQRKDMFRSRMRCDPKTKCKMAKIHNKKLTIQHHSWISFSGNICALPSIFNLLSI